MIKKTFICLGVTALLISSSCATVIRGTEEKIVISTEPSGASVEVFDSSNQRVTKLTTPSTVKLKKANSPLNPETYRVKIAKEGFKDAEFTVGNKVNVGAFVIGNFIFYLIPGMVIDGLTGAMYNMIPSNTNGENMTISNSDSFVKVDLVKK